MPTCLTRLQKIQERAVERLRPEPARDRAHEANQNVPAVLQAFRDFNHRVGALILVFDIGRERILLLLQQKQNFLDGVCPSPQRTFAPRVRRPQDSGSGPSGGDW